MDRYTHTRLEDQVEALERLPDLSSPKHKDVEEQRATGN
jgi:hypothetical protein